MGEPPTCLPCEVLTRYLHFEYRPGAARKVGRANRHRGSVVGGPGRSKEQRKAFNV